MRNIFDQYDQAENRITHALMSALDLDRSLLNSFLRHLVSATPPVPAKKLGLLEQQLPGEDSPTEEDLDHKGIPDGWIYSEDHSWCLIIECKVIAKFSQGQIDRHKRTAIRRGFKTIKILCILPTTPLSEKRDVPILEWHRVYTWLKQHACTSEWAVRAARYIEIAEERLIQSNRFLEGRLTAFSGFPFGMDQPYNYLEAKRLLGLALEELKSRRRLQKQLGMNPSIGGRSAITGRDGDAVWDFLSLAPSGGSQAFTKFPHLTLGITARGIDAMLTVPHAVNSTMRGNISRMGEEGFQELIARTVSHLEPLLKSVPGASPRFVGVQRRYPSQRAKPFLDARIDFDLRTIVRFKHGPKVQPLWLSAAYGAFVDRAGSNYQIQIGVSFSYDQCPELRDGRALDLIERSWLACRELVTVDKDSQK